MAKDQARLGASGGEPAKGRNRLTDKDLERSRILLSAGLDEAAMEEMQRVSRRARSLQDRLTMAQLFSEVGGYHDAQRLIVDAYTEQLARGAAPYINDLARF